MPFWARGNYAPVEDEIEAFDLEVLGALPAALDGLFVRNGANQAAGVADHWFLGDGMVHGIRLEQGRASWYRNRWIATHALTQGSDAVSANRANTSVVHHHGRLLALYEAGGPTEIDTVSLDTVGPYDFAGTLEGAMTAHPKVDAATGELFFIGYSPFPPYLRFSTVDPAGGLTKTVAIDVPVPTMMHDFQLTARHAVFMDFPVVFDLGLLENGFPFAWRPEHGARIGVMPRDGGSEDVVWVDVPTCYMFHTFNAYEDAQGRIVLEGCRLESLDVQGVIDTSEAPVPWVWTIDVENRTATDGPLLDFGMDFPMIDRRVQGREHRFDYGLRLTPGTADYPAHPVGIVKHDRVSGRTDLWSVGEAVQPDEALFVPAPGSEGEDEGWLLSVVFNRATGASEVVVLDASAVQQGPIARVLLPRRIPFGFHGAWVPAG